MSHTDTDTDTDTYICTYTGTDFLFSWINVTKAIMFANNIPFDTDYANTNRNGRSNIRMVRIAH